MDAAANIRHFILLFLVAAAPAALHAQVLKVATIVVRPNIGTGSLTVSASPAMVAFNLVPGSSSVGNSPVSITTTWSGSTVGSTMSLYGYFSNASAALTGNASSVPIPSSAVSGQVTTGLPSSYTPFTQTNSFGAASASLKLFSQVIAGSGAGSRTDALSLQIDLTNLLQLPADTYVGTLIIQAQVI